MLRSRELNGVVIPLSYKLISAVEAFENILEYSGILWTIVTCSLFRNSLQNSTTSQIIVIVISRALSYVVLYGLEVSPSRYIRNSWISQSSSEFHSFHENSSMFGNNLEHTKTYKIEIIVQLTVHRLVQSLFGNRMENPE